MQREQLKPAKTGTTDHNSGCPTGRLPLWPWVAFPRHAYIKTHLNPYRLQRSTPQAPGASTARVRPVPCMLVLLASIAPPRRVEKAFKASSHHQPQARPQPLTNSAGHQMPSLLGSWFCVRSYHKALNLQPTVCARSPALACCPVLMLGYDPDLETLALVATLQGAVERGT